MVINEWISYVFGIIPAAFGVKRDAVECGAFIP